MVRDQHHLLSQIRPPPICLSAFTGPASNNASRPWIDLPHTVLLCYTHLTGPDSPMKTLLLILLCASNLSAASVPWNEILGPPKGQVPPAKDWTVTWRTDLNQSLSEAKAQNRPLFVTFRCLPCKQCSAFDKEVLEG